MHLVGVQVNTPKDEDLPDFVVGSTVQVFRGKGRLIYDFIAASLWRMICCSTSCMLLCLQFLDNLFGLALGALQAVHPSTKAVQESTKIS